MVVILVIVVVVVVVVVVVIVVMILLLLVVVVIHYTAHLNFSAVRKVNRKFLELLPSPEVAIL